MEIVGLLVIVVLIVLIIFFSVVFKTKTTDNTKIIAFQDTKLASQLGTVIVETKIKCDTTNILLRELMEDCATTKNIRCGTKNSCQILNETIEKILNETLAIDLEYILRIKTQSNELMTNFTTNYCENPRATISFFNQRIPIRDAQLEMNIGLCT